MKLTLASVSSQAANLKERSVTDGDSVAAITTMLISAQKRDDGRIGELWKLLLRKKDKQ